jgi:hypothetical protein
MIRVAPVAAGTVITLAAALLAALGSCATSKGPLASGPTIVAIGSARALVPDSLARPAAAEDAGALVAAKADSHGVLRLERVLCRRDETYGGCAAAYQPGIFDANTGRELTRDHQPKRDGALVDVSSYVKLSADPDHHSASELDARAGQHCDCNRALPGSVQSSVPIPQSDR